MAKYMTKQRTLLLNFLSDHADETLSAGQIVKALSDKGISASAVYRNLSMLEQEGRVRRTAKAGIQEAFYRCVDTERCRGHLYLSCLRCGKTVHMEENETDELVLSLAKNEGFTLDRTDTVLYGICADCKD